MVNDEQRKWIQRQLLDWYDQNKRELPWRKDKNPYKIWISEVMLQQTRVETVIPYYKRFIKKFPSLLHLANAEEEEVIKAWEGLGYYSRARNLHTAAKEVVAKYRGQMPNTYEEISSLKGVGPYTAGAILSIAFDQKFAAVDGNVLRVAARLFALTDDIKKVATRKKVERLMLAVIPDHAPGDFNQALMELGATVCTPTSPTCLLCPLREVCQGFAKGIQEELPIKKKAKPPQKIPVVFLWIEHDGHILLEKRDHSGLLAQMWGLPTLEQVSPENATSKIEKYVTSSVSWEEIGTFDHLFSHRHWQVSLIRLGVVRKDDCHVKKRQRWVRIQDVSNIALANVYRKAWKIGLSSR